MGTVCQPLHQGVRCKPNTPHSRNQGNAGHGHLLVLINTDGTETQQPTPHALELGTTQVQQKHTSHSIRPRGPRRAKGGMARRVFFRRHEGPATSLVGGRTDWGFSGQWRDPGETTGGDAKESGGAPKAAGPGSRAEANGNVRSVNL